MRKFFVALALVFIITVTTMATVDMNAGSQINTAREAKNINRVNNNSSCCCMTINSLSLNLYSVQLQNAELLVIKETTNDAFVNVVQNNSNLTNNLSSMTTVTTNTSGSTFSNNLIRQFITSWTAQNIVLSSSLYNYNSAAKNLNMIAYNTGQLWMAPDIVLESQYIYIEESEKYVNCKLSSYIIT